MQPSAFSGIRVLDMTRLLPGGLCTLFLADLGADVIKVEALPSGDYARNRAPHHESSEPSISSASFIGLNRNKRSIVLDLKAEFGPMGLLRLVETADVVVESLRPGVLDRLGVGYEAMRQANPQIILCSISGWGQSGPLADAVGHDVNYLATMGLLSFTGSVDEQPVIPQVQMADSSGALFGVAAILTALHERRTSGEGQQIDVSLAHAALSMASMTVAGALATGQMQPRAGGLCDGGVVCYQVYRCADGWVALGALEEKFWTTWCKAVDRPDLSAGQFDPPGSAAFDEVAQIFAGRTRAEWAELAANHDCCLTVISGLVEALDSATVTDRGIVGAVTQPGVAGPFRALGLPVRFSRTPADLTRLPAPALGEHTRQVLEEGGLSVDMVNAVLNVESS